MIGILGGSFDPVHYGHLRTALEILEGVDMDELRLVPSNIPPHREGPVASAPMRLAMVRAAVEDIRGINVDERELQRTGPSYSFDTLASLRAELGDEVPLCMITGLDAFLGLPTWHRWREILDVSHILVAHRPGYGMSFVGPLADVMDSHQTDSVADLHARPGGRILLFGATQLDISSTAIRDMVSNGRSARFLLPDSVIEVITANELYH